LEKYRDNNENISIVITVWTPLEEYMQLLKRKEMLGPAGKKMGLGFPRLRDLLNVM